MKPSEIISTLAGMQTNKEMRGKMDAGDAIDTLSRLIFAARKLQNGPQHTHNQNHTPGPWQAVEVDEGIFHIDTATGSRTQIGDVATVYDAAFPNEYKANAALIAAAPELLEALENARIALTFYANWMRKHCPAGNNSSEYPFGLDAERQARAAIAKAKGQ